MAMAMRVGQEMHLGDDDACDEQLAARSARGDRAAFDRLDRRYRADIARYANRRLNDDDRSTEVAALTIERAWGAIGGFRGGHVMSFRAWLYTIAGRVVMDEYRHRRHEPLASAVALPETNPRYLPEAAAEIGDRRSALQAALAQLPEDQRRIVELRLSGLNGIEIATVLGRTHASIKSSQFRAYQRLRTLLIDHQGEPS